MKNIKKFDEYNKIDESIFGNVSRLQPGSRPETKNKLLGRMDDDNYAAEIFEEMKEDFEKYNKDLNKVKIIGDSKLIYIFGKYHVTKNSTQTGNFNDEPLFDNVLNKKITVTYIKPELLLNPNSLEKHFGVSKGLKLAKGRMEIDETLKNPNYNPNFSPKWNEVLSPSEKEMVRMIDRREEDFKITYDLAKEIFSYFDKEYIKKYPQLKNAKYKNEWSIKEIENGKKPNLGYLHETDIKGNNITYDYTDIKDKKKIENFIKNNVILTGKNKDRYPITYFTLPNEDEETIKSNMENMSQEDIKKQNMERVYSFKK